MPRRRGKGSGFEMRVANLYRKGGYSVERNRIINGFEFDAIAKRKREKLVIEAKNWKKEPIHSGVINSLIKKARTVRGKPILVINRSSKLTNPAKEIAKKKGVRIKRI